jgi:acyl-CoA synthetase (AMP-forming)/AMP-acid ligase II
MGLIGGILAPLYGGFPVVLMSPFLFLQRPIRWLRAISQHQATTSGGPNFAYDLCVQKIKTEDLGDLDLSSWKVAFNGAEPIRSDCMRRFTEKFAPYGFRHESFYPCYGMAEATLIISGGLRSAAPVVKAFDRISLEQNQVKRAINCNSESQELVGCGQTLSKQEIVIVHPNKLTQCHNGEVGEIWVQGSSVAQGYWNQTENTQETFNAYLINSGKGPYLRTGDLGFIQDGELFVTGRLKDIIIIRGSNYYPQDIERTVEQSHSSLCSNASAVFSIELENEERLVIVAEVERRYSRNFKQAVNQGAHEKCEQDSNTLQKNTAPSDEQSKDLLTVLNQLVGDIREAVTQQYNLQPYAIALIQVGSIPKTSSGKVQRYACKSAFLAKTLNIVHMYCLV